ncbi:MAG: hypothetical protein R3C56_23205 [Pirellulaceae bacterium]
MIAASAVALIVVPLWLLPLMQLLSLSLLMAALLRLGCVVCRMRDNGSPYRGRSSVVSGLTMRRRPVYCYSSFLVRRPSAKPTHPTHPTHPPTHPSANLSVPTSPGQADREREIFSVLIPIDEAGKSLGPTPTPPRGCWNYLLVARQIRVPKRHASCRQTIRCVCNAAC